MMRRIVPLMLMPLSEWQMKPVNDGIGHHVGIGIYAQVTDGGHYVRTWFKWPWGCLPNNVVGVEDLIRCGVMQEFLDYLDGHEPATIE